MFVNGLNVKRSWGSRKKITDLQGEGGPILKNF